jgi:hypothetical protein
VSHLEDLPVQDRIQIYREHATRMMELARSCSSEPMRVAYLRLAAQWQSLVLELERSSGVTAKVEPVWQFAMERRG